MNLAVVYEDEHILAVSKPVGRLVIPGRNGGEESVIEELSRLWEQKLYVVHRIDRDASGLVLFARDADTHRLLSRQFENHHVTKKYDVVVRGRTIGNGVIDKPIRQFGSGRMGVDTRGKKAVTRYRVKEFLPGATLLDVNIVTGRRHQIRVHFYSLDHPVMGETRYGRDFPVGGVPRLLLHAREIVCDAMGKPGLVIHAPPTADFAEAVEMIRRSGDYEDTSPMVTA